MKFKLLSIFWGLFFIYLLSSAYGGPDIWCPGVQCNEGGSSCTEIFNAIRCRDDKPGYNVYCQYVKSGEEACGLGCGAGDVYTCGYKPISTPNFSIIKSPEISVGVQVIGSQLKISGTFSGGIYGTSDSCSVSPPPGGGGGSPEPPPGPEVPSYKYLLEKILSFKNFLKQHLTFIKIGQVKALLPPDGDGGDGGNGSSGGTPQYSCCVPFIIKEVKYQIDNIATKTLSCWQLIESGSTPGNCSSQLKVFKYKFTENCFINIAGYSPGVHKLKLIFVNSDKPGGETTKEYSFVIPSGGGGTSGSAWVDIKANGSDGPINVPFNSSVTLSWNSSNVSSCQASGSWAGTKNISGSEIISNLTASAIFTLICNSGDGQVTDSVMVNVGEAPPNPDLYLVHYLKNVSQGSSWAKEIIAKKDQVVEFAINIKANGNIFVKNVVVKNLLPSGIIFESGSLKIDGESRIGGEELFSTGLNLGTLPAGGVKRIGFRGKVISSGGSLENKVVVEGVGVPPREVISKIIITEAPTKIISLIKTGRNLTKKTDFSPFVEGSPGDVLEFKIEIINSGNEIIKNVRLFDDLPSIFNYLSGSVKVDGVPSSGDIFGSGLNLGNISLNQRRIVSFSAKVSQTYYYDVGDNFFQNIARVYAEGLDPILQKLDIKIINSTKKSSPLPTPTTPLSEKSILAYNETKKGDATLIFAEEGEVIYFSLFTKNNTSRTLNNFEIKVDISDLLKTSELISLGEGKISGNFLVYSGLVVPPGETITKEFKIKIKKANEWGEINHLSVVYGNKITINLKKPVEKLEPKLMVNKSIFNLTWPNGSLQEISARVSDKLKFKIEITNEGKAMIGDLKVIETLPSELGYISSEEGEYQILTHEIVWNLGTLLPNEKKELVWIGDLRYSPQKEVSWKNLLANLISSTPDNFLKIFAKIEAFTGYENIHLKSNPVLIKFVTPKKPFPYLRIILYILILILVIFITFLLFRQILRKKMNNS